MKKVNFGRFPVYQGINKAERLPVDISESLANVIYSNVAGIAGHVLAEKIYKEKEVELNVEEIGILHKVTELLPGVYADSINDHLKELEGEV